MDVRELERKIVRQPFNQESINQFLSQNEVKVTVDDIEGRKGSCKYVYPGFIIQINPLITKREKLITFTHELVHCMYRVRAGYINPNRDNVEGLIESKAQEFYCQNESFLSKTLGEALAGKYLTPQEVSKSPRFHSFFGGDYFYFEERGGAPGRRGRWIWDRIIGSRLVRFK